jgi:hypothetical protein
MNGKYACAAALLLAAPAAAAVPAIGTSETAMWPACRPGPGDDRCIQLYERGVRTAFAQWSAGGSENGMGGPEETSHHDAPASARAASMPLTAKDESLPRMQTSAGRAPEPGDKDAPAMPQPETNAGEAPNNAQPAGDDGRRTAEEMRGGSVWSQSGGLSGATER